MRTLRTLVWVCCYLSLPQVTHASPSEGYVIGWGYNTAGQATGVPSIRFSNGAFSMTDNPWATNTVMIADQVLSNAVEVSAGFGHSLAVRSDGTVAGWGGNDLGIALGYETPYPGRTNGIVSLNGRILSNVVSVAAGRGFSVALNRDGTVVAWGRQARIEDIPKLLSQNGMMLFDPKTGLPMPFDPEINPKTGLPWENIKINPVTGLPEPVENPERGHVTRVGILSDGTVATRLDDQNPISLSNVVAIAAVNYSEWALKSDGTVVGWSGQPQNYGGQLVSVANLSNVVAFAAGPGDYNVPVALKKDGTVEEFYHEANNRDTAPPAGLSNVVAVAAGNSYTLALTRDGTATGWGFNNVGQATGLPTTNSPNISPASRVSLDGHTLSNIVAITAGQGFSMALKGDGTVVVWGRLANGVYPATVPAGLSNVVAIAEGENFCLAITTNRAVAEKFWQK